MFEPGLCEGGGGECHGSDPSLLQFNFGGRMLSWAAFPSLLFLLLFAIYVVLTRVVANPLVRRACAPLCRAACPCCSRAGSRPCCGACGGVGEDEGGSFPPYPQALKITAQARPARAHPCVPVFSLETFVSCASLRASFPVLP